MPARRFIRDRDRSLAPSRFPRRTEAPQRIECSIFDPHAGSGCAPERHALDRSRIDLSRATMPTSAGRWINGGNGCCLPDNAGSDHGKSANHVELGTKCGASRAGGGAGACRPLPRSARTCAGLEAAVPLPEETGCHPRPRGETGAGTGRHGRGCSHGGGLHRLRWSSARCNGHRHAQALAARNPGLCMRATDGFAWTVPHPDLMTYNPQPRKEQDDGNQGR